VVSKPCCGPADLSVDAWYIRKILNWPLRYEVNSDCALASLPLQGEHERITRFDYQYIYGEHGREDKK
jgi:hypothetical protein